MNYQALEPITIVCAADDGYAMPLAVVIHSVLKHLNSKRKANFFIIDGGIKEKNKRKILKFLDPKRCQIHWLQPPNDLLKNAKLSGHIKVAAYYRLLIPELLPHHLHKAIYLDSDLIVKADLELLWNVDMKKKELLAVEEFSLQYVCTTSVNYQELGIPPHAKYFNSGVLVFNLEKWRNHNVTTEALTYMEKNRDYIKWHDQDVLNGVLVGRWGQLDPRWNQTPSIYTYTSWKEQPFSEEVYSDILHNPYIIHFAASSKPWRDSRNNHPARNLFFQYLDMTAWSGWRLTFSRRLWRKIFITLKSLRNFVFSSSVLRSHLSFKS